MYYFGTHYAGISFWIFPLHRELFRFIRFNQLLGGIKVKRKQRKPGFRDIEAQAFVFVRKNWRQLKDKGGKIK
jgi:hypothetical protein